MAAFAVSRTFTSLEDARYATLGLDDASNRSRSRSATLDSPRLADRSVRDTIVAGPASAASSGRIVPSIISSISTGTPGTA